jgi:methyl-accepting chemotaxis protein
MEKAVCLPLRREGMWKDAEENRPAWDRMRSFFSEFLSEKATTSSLDSLEYSQLTNYSPEVPRVALSLDNYLSAVKRFNESVSEIAGKLEQLNTARAEALKASEELKKELETTDRQMQEVAAGLGQQISAQTGGKKSVQAEEVLQSAAVRRAS